MSHCECDAQFEASKALLENSGLARWDDQTFTFVPMCPASTIIADSCCLTEQCYRHLNTRHQF